MNDDVSSDGALSSYFSPKAQRLRLPGHDLAYYSKAGVRGHPNPHPGVLLMAEGLSLGALHLVDATAGAGLLALVAKARGLAEQVTVLEPSQAAGACAARTLAGLPEVTLTAALPWDGVAEADAVALAPATDRGTARVQAEIDGAHALLRTGGRLYAVMHKDEGAKRYEGYLKERLGALEVLAKRGGWRLVRGTKRREDVRPALPIRFEAAGLELAAEPGVFAAGKLDPGTAALLDALELTGLAGTSLAGQRVLDLGCGYGLLALKAAGAGAKVTGLDDDLAAVRSSRANAASLGLEAAFLHSDVDSALGGEARFDLVLANPPFHVGKRVVLEVPRAFLAAAKRRLLPGGRLVLVANAALPYELELANWSSWRERARQGGFKVLEALR
ncbi:MAG: methyltransferase [Deinococcota bacterium]|jgi:16S rRNA (guanine1207-N2)-methyltransferase|nr:methyltransferase [Deinococcota bacterium]